MPHVLIFLLCLFLKQGTPPRQGGAISTNTFFTFRTVVGPSPRTPLRNRKRYKADRLRIDAEQLGTVRIPLDVDANKIEYPIFFHIVGGEKDHEEEEEEESQYVF